VAEGFWHGIEVVPVTTRAAPGVRTPATSVIGVVGTSALSEKLTAHTPFLVRGAREARELFGGLDAPGSLPKTLAAIYEETQALCVVVSVGLGEADAPALQVAGTQGELTGVYSLLKAKAALGAQPRIVIAPEFSADESVRAALNVVAGRLRAVAPIESPDSQDLQAVIGSFASLRSSRLYPVYPNVRLAAPIGVVGGSALAAAVIAKTDAQLGFWVSPSNRLCSSVVGVSHPVEFSLDPSSGESGANLLNKNKIATFVNEQGFRLWGNRTLFDEADALDARHKFINVRRLRDFIDDAILASHLWAVDRNITKSYVSQVTESINNYFRDLKAQEAILGGHCWIDPEVNSVSQITEGHVTFDYEFTPPYPAERITFRSLLSDDHIKEVF
jgi:phage tail sheath protein FI